MKKTLLKISMFLMVAVFASLGTQTTIVGLAEKDAALPQVVETVAKEQKGILSVKRCDFTYVIGEKEVYLPSFKAVSANGEDISNSVVISDNLQSVIDEEMGTIILKEDGVHTITYSVFDPATSETLTRSFEITRYREIFNFYNLSGEISQYGGKDTQYCTSLNSGQGISRFNLPASQLYYAEVYFNETTATLFWEGLAHVEYVNEDKGTNSNNWFASLVDATDGMKHKFYTDLNWSFKEVSGTSTETSLTVGQGFKYAVARNGNTFYAFINDVLVDEYVDLDMNGKNTVPGIFTVAKSGGDFVSEGGLKISNIDFYDGEQAAAQIAKLVG